MKIILASVGKVDEPEYRDLIIKYTSRISHYADVDWLIREKEESILKAIHKDDYVILLDERGTELASTELADRIESISNQSYKRLYFIIGGAYGSTTELIARADYKLSFSRLVFPHMLMRIILAEQVYRAFTILRGEKYHHE